eukprot:3241959-Amphidinium_carterae.1
MEHADSESNMCRHGFATAEPAIPTVSAGSTICRITSPVMRVRYTLRNVIPSAHEAKNTSDERDAVGTAAWTKVLLIASCKPELLWRHSNSRKRATLESKAGEFLAYARQCTMEQTDEDLSEECGAVDMTADE